MTDIVFIQELGDWYKLVDGIWAKDNTIIKIYFQAICDEIALYFEKNQENKKLIELLASLSTRRTRKNIIDIVECFFMTR